MRAFGFASATIIALALFAGGLSAIPNQASAAAADVSIIALSCDTDPEYVRIKNFGGSSQSLSGFHIESDPSQDYTLTDFVIGIEAGATLEFQSGSAAADSSGVYRMTGAFILRNSDPTDYARLVRPGTTSDQVNCGDTPTTPTAVPTSSPSPTASPTATATASPTGTATPTPTTQATDTATPSPTGGPTLIWGDHNCSGSANPVDSLLTLRADAGLSTNTGDCPDFGESVSALVAALYTWGDVDCGGDVTPVDSLKLLRFDAGLSVSQEANCPTIGEPI